MLAYLLAYRPPQVDRPKAQYIGQLELLAAVVAYTTFPAALAGRHVFHWMNNESAVYSLAKGYSGAADSARVVNLYHACVAQLGVTPWPSSMWVRMTT